MEDGISRGLQHCHEMCCEKGGYYGRQACMVQRWFQHYFWTGGLVYDSRTSFPLISFNISQNSYALQPWTILQLDSRTFFSEGCIGHSQGMT